MIGSTAETERESRARSIERASRADLAAFQAEQLVPTVDAVSRSRFWRKRFDAAGLDPASVTHPDDLYAVPAIQKRDYFSALAESPEDYGGLLCDRLEAIAHRGAIVYRTTGTSGKQGSFVNSHEGFRVFGAQGAELFRAAGAERGDPVMITFPLTVWAASWGFYYAARLGPFTLIPAGAPIDTAARIALIRDYRPRVITLTPSYAVTLGRALREEGLRPSNYGVRGLVIGGEVFGPRKRALIEELWEVPGGTRNNYGVTEGGPLFAVECEHQNGMHLFEGDTIHQFWRIGKNEPAEPGELAEHVITSISQRTMATAFNFRTRDAAEFSDEPCPCGRTTRRMWVRERLDDMVKVKGINIFASGVEELLGSVDGAGPEFRLVVERVAERDRLTLQVEAHPARDREVLGKEVVAAMRSGFGVSFDVELLEPATLPVTELKARRWLDRRPKD